MTDQIKLRLSHQFTVHVEIRPDGMAVIVRTGRPDQPAISRKYAVLAAGNKVTWSKSRDITASYWRTTEAALLFADKMGWRVDGEVRLPSYD